MSGSSLDAFTKPAEFTDFGWLALLTNQLAPLRDIFGDGPEQLPVAAAVATRVAVGRGTDRPRVVSVQIEPGSPAVACFFGRGQGTVGANGFAFTFLVNPTFRQLLFPSDELWVFSPVPTRFTVYQLTL